MLSTKMYTYIQSTLMVRKFLEHQIRKLEWFLKDHVTLKTGIMVLKIQICHPRNKFYNCNCNNIYQYCSFTLFLNKFSLRSKTQQKSHWPQMVTCMSVLFSPLTCPVCILQVCSWGVWPECRPPLGVSRASLARCLDTETYTCARNSIKQSKGTLAICL